MMRNLVASLLIAVSATSCSTTAVVAPSKATSDRAIADKTASMTFIDGFIPLHWDAKEGKMWMEIGRWNEEILYQISLPAGVGSNPIGLDRNQLGGTHVVRFERVGPRVLMIEPNYGFRALTDDPVERQSVEDSFARSVLWGFKVEVEQGDRVLVDATPFFLRDAHGVIPTLQATNQGSYRLEESRSAFHLARTKGFPKNTEIEVTLTFVGDQPGRLIRSVTPWAQAVTVREHFSFVELPDDGYVPRRFDPRVGFFGITFHDFGSAVSEPIEKRWISRHRLQKTDPSAAVSDPIDPIVYYLDPGTPEPIRSALIEGASWWNEGFEAAGFRNAFRVEILPPDADPMDARYNMISWVHRSTRGWSYGGGIIDPRTGEIIKGNVSLGSLRVRQDVLLGMGLVPLFDQNDRGPDAEHLAPLDPSADAVEMALARIRQLSAHEVGHTLGLAHNFAASTYGRASVMDYPAPLVEIREGKLDLSNAYSHGIGEYDKFAVTWAYAQFPPGTDETAALETVIRDGIAKGMLFITDEDARPAGAAHPLASLWDNGSDPVEMLSHEMEVRAIALEQFGLGNIPSGTPASMLEATLLPLYLHHRYQLEAAVKSVGGVHYTYAVKTGEGTSPREIRRVVEPAQQRRALDAVLDTLNVNALKLPSSVLAVIPPPAFGHRGGPTELFSKRTDPMFDPIGAATIAADVAVSALLQPERAARLVEQKAFDGGQLGFEEVVDSLIGLTWRSDTRENGYEAAIQRAVRTLVITRLMELAANQTAAADVRAITSQAMRDLAALIRKAPGKGIDGAHRRATLDDIERFLDRPMEPRRQIEPLEIPPGSPIG